MAVGKLAAHLTGGFQTQGETQVMNLKLSAPNMSVDELESLLPIAWRSASLGIQVDRAAHSRRTWLSAGPLDKLVIAGPVRMSNTKLAGFDMGSKLGALSAFNGKAPANPDTIIQNASLNARMAPDRTRADAINVTIPSLGVVTGAGTISPSGALNFNMTADLQTNRSEARTERTGRGADRGGVSFRIQGTTSNPTFDADVASLAGNAAKGVVVQRSVSGKTGGGVLPKRRGRSRSFSNNFITSNQRYWSRSSELPFAFGSCGKTDGRRHNPTMGLLDLQRLPAEVVSEPEGCSL